MKRRNVLKRTVLLLLALALAFGQSAPAVWAGMDMPSHWIEPDAAHWGTWALESADELRPAAPPDAGATAAEMEELAALAAQRDNEARALVKYWDAGAPGYRWLEMTNAAYQPLPFGFFTFRAHALVTVAMYDATIAAWDAKYAYNRPRPATFDPAFSPLIPTPDSPSYVSEYAAVAGAASTVLAYLFPDNAAMYAAKAEEAGRSRLLAGVEYPSDVAAGLALGRAVGERVVAIAQTDNSDAQWDGTRPAGPGILTTENPVFPMSGGWRAWTLESNDQFRAPPPPAHDSEETAAELAEIKAITRTIPIIASAIGWNSFEDGYAPWYYNTSLRLFESGLDRNAPLAALAYSAIAIASYDAMVACFDSKYTYWRIRPDQLDPEVTTIFPTPPHPSYPAAHSCSSTSVTSVIAHLFPADAASILAMGEEAGLSRIWAGIHYRSDIDAGSALGKSVAEVVLARIQAMTNQSPEAQKIANALSAGPERIAQNAAVLDWPGEAGGGLVELRAGTNGWSCLPDDPSTPTNDPMCVDANWLEFLDAILSGREPQYTGVGISYMLQGGSSASTTDYTAMAPPDGEAWMIDPPHLMIVVPWDLDPAHYSTDPMSGGPWIMWEGSPYEHLMVPVAEK